MPLYFYYYNVKKRSSIFIFKFSVKNNQAEVLNETKVVIKTKNNYNT